MAFTLGEITLPYPKKFTREFVEVGAENLLMEGKTTKRTETRKEVFVLEYQHLTQAQVNSILSEYELDVVRTFTVTETNLAISATGVLVNVVGREYPASGELYRENLTLILTEVI